MKRFRIVESNGAFYPEYKSLFLWRRFQRPLPPISNCTTVTGANGVGASTLDDAREILRLWVEMDTDVIHKT